MKVLGVAVLAEGGVEVEKLRVELDLGPDEFGEGLPDDLEVARGRFLAVVARCFGCCIRCRSGRCVLAGTAAAGDGDRRHRGLFLR